MKNKRAMHIRMSLKYLMILLKKRLGKLVQDVYKGSIKRIVMLDKYLRIGTSLTIIHATWYKTII